MTRPRPRDITPKPSTDRPPEIRGCWWMAPECQQNPAEFYRRAKTLHQVESGGSTDTPVYLKAQD